MQFIRVPLNSITFNALLVVGIKAGEALVKANRELITRMEQKIQKTLTRIWAESDHAGD